ncbi:hypothetical protein DEO72_LG6g832 [Vigna unguiculata]|uniref:Uncharacterized protein n=1 Tax=Vigna unguiculata TaxID=3917 RepID=A0A4D6M627_VIGUN|nr:hypothetical protein DEO72_LG6g832 [Vigna unguiculata]
MGKITHKRKNGTYVNDEAMEIGVRGLSFGACPTLAFQQCLTAKLSGINFASSSGTSSNMENRFVMKSELATVKNQVNQMQTVIAYIASKEDIPEPLGSMVAAFVHSSSNEDLQSGAPSPNGVARSSGGSKTD